MIFIQTMKILYYYFITTWIDLILTNQKQLFMKFRIFINSISGFLALSTSNMKLTYVKGNTKTKFYRDYKSFGNDLFQFDLEYGWINLTDPANTSFEKIFLRTLVYHAPINKKTLWTNENSSISKALHKSIL